MGDVTLSVISGTERDAFDALCIIAEKTSSYRGLKARLVAMHLVDEDGARLFPDKELGALSSKSSAVIARLFNECCKLSGIEAGAIEELEGN